MRAYVNAGLLDYLKTRYDSTNTSRLAIIPFNVPESFAPSGMQSRHFGRDIALNFHQEIVGSGELGIVELFNRDRWPGKRAEFSHGNYQAIESARNAGYDLVLVGYLEDIVNETDLTLLTKLIDTSNGVTLWYGRTVTYSARRPLRRSISEYSFGFVRDRPDSFAFQERVAEMARCTVDSILYGETVEPGNNQQKEESWAGALLSKITPED